MLKYFKTTKSIKRSWLFSVVVFLFIALFFRGFVGDKTATAFFIGVCAGSFLTYKVAKKEIDEQWVWNASQKKKRLREDD